MSNGEVRIQGIGTIESESNASTPGSDFWRAGPGLDAIPIEIRAPERSLEILEKLGPSPFERGGFPLIGFLATTYEKVTRIALSDGADAASGDGEKRRSLEAHPPT